MKTIRQSIFSFLMISAVAHIFVACSNEQIAFSDKEIVDGEAVYEAAPLQKGDADYEIIPIGTNSYVYVPKMTSTKATTRSAETEKTYSASVYCNEIGLRVTITWNGNGASYSLDNYMSDLEIFNYKINGSSINITEFRLRIYGNTGAHLCNVVYSGTLKGA